MLINRQTSTVVSKRRGIESRQIIRDRYRFDDWLVRKESECRWLNLGKYSNRSRCISHQFMGMKDVWLIE